MARLLTRAVVDDFCKQLKANGCLIHHDREAGTIRALDGETVVFSAIEKFHDGPWIARFTNSDRISWSGDETNEEG